MSLERFGLMSIFMRGIIPETASCKFTLTCSFGHGLTIVNHICANLLEANPLATTGYRQNKGGWRAMAKLGNQLLQKWWLKMEFLGVLSGNVGDLRCTTMVWLVVWQVTLLICVARCNLLWQYYCNNIEFIEVMKYTIPWLLQWGCPFTSVSVGTNLNKLLPTSTYNLNPCISYIHLICTNHVVSSQHVLVVWGSR